MTGPSRLSIAVGVACAIALFGIQFTVAGCGDSAQSLPGLGQPCSSVLRLCSPGLSCGSAGFCEKRCQCDGGTTCVPDTLANGCTPNAVCVVTAEDSSGSCKTACGGTDMACPVGEGACARGPDGRQACVGAGFSWFVPDAGVDGM